MAANKNLSLVFIILFLLLSLTGVVLGLYNIITYEEEIKVLSLSNGTEEIGKYECVYSDNCFIAKGTVDEGELDYYKHDDTSLYVMLDRYAFIVDNDLGVQDTIKLYDINTKKVINEFSGVKNYGIGIEGNLLIASIADYWGIIKLSEDGVELMLDYHYSYIGLHNILTINNKLQSDEFVLYNNGIYKITNAVGLEYSTSFNNEIIRYNSSYLVIDDEEEELLYTYNGQRLLDEYEASEILLLGKYAGIYDSENNKFVLYDILRENAYKEYEYTEPDDVFVDVVEGVINVVINDELEDQIRLS